MRQLWTTWNVCFHGHCVQIGWRKYIVQLSTILTFMSSCLKRIFSRKEAPKWPFLVVTSDTKMVTPTY